MALILCHQCFSWVEPLGEQCPQCDFPLDARRPDPSAQQLGDAIGNLVRPIGDVRITRTELPDRGSLYETTNGLFFVPHRLDHVKLVLGGKPRSALRGFVAAWLRGPLALFWFSRNRGGSARMEIAVDEQPPLSPRDSGQLPLLLMRHPGVFFLARRSIRDVRRTLWGWTIRRRNNLVLRLKPLADRGSFHDRMCAFAAGFGEAVCP